MIKYYTSKNSFSEVIELANTDIANLSSTYKPIQIIKDTSKVSSYQIIYTLTVLFERI